MLKAKEIKEIRNYLGKSENPLIFYDDDCDGLCSYLLLRDYLDRGRGVVVKSLPVLDVPFLRKVRENSPDYVFVVDMPIITQNFVDNISVPIIWIDHHPLIDIKGVKYYNVMNYRGGEKESCTSMCYKIVGGKLWLAMLGGVADWRIPSYRKEFVKQYPDLFSNKIKKPGDGYYKTELGKLIRIFSFILKSSTSDIHRIVSALLRIDSPYEILNQETMRGKFIYKFYEKIGRHYDELLKETLSSIDKKSNLILFTYVAKRYSFTSDLSNELIYRYPDKIIVVAREKDGEMKFSVRSSKIDLTPLVEKAKKDLNGRCGGHKHAMGGNFKKEDFKVFVERLKELI